MPKSILCQVGIRSLYAEMHGAGSLPVMIETGSTIVGTSDPGWRPFINEQGSGMVMDVIQRLLRMQGGE